MTPDEPMRSPRAEMTSSAKNSVPAGSRKRKPGEDDVSARQADAYCMNPMDTFDPDMPCRVHDKVNDQIFEWNPQWASMFREYGAKWGEGIVAWDGLLLDGWTPIMHGHPSGH